MIFLNATFAAFTYHIPRKFLEIGSVRSKKMQITSKCLTERLLETQETIFVIFERQFFALRFSSVYCDLLSAWFLTFDSIHSKLNSITMLFNSALLATFALGLVSAQNATTNGAAYATGLLATLAAAKWVSLLLEPIADRIEAGSLINNSVKQ